MLCEDQKSEIQKDGEMFNAIQILYKIDDFCKIKYASRKNNISSVTLINDYINWPPSKNIITGLSQGLAGSIISIKGKITNIFQYCAFREIISTVTHEVLHILGLDHCSDWACICNFAYQVGFKSKEGGFLMLCPLCLRKLN